MEFTIQQIAELLNGEVKGDRTAKINMLAKIQDAKPGQITFLSNPKYEQYIYQTQASAVIVHKDFLPKKEIGVSLILVENPYSAFTQILEEYYKLIHYQKEGVEQPAYLGKNSTIGKAVYRGAFSYIGDNVTIGDHVKIFPHTYIGDHVVIGNNTVLHPNVKVYASTRIGDYCDIHAGVVIGSDGFGFAPQQDGTYKSIPQLGNVIIEDHVTIGANTVIDCATLFGDATTIRAGVKLDNLIQIAHNVEIGRNTVIAAQAGISGSTKLGENCVLAGQVGVAGHLIIASNTSVGAQAGVMKSIKEKGERLMGSPVFDVKDFFKSYAAFKQLPSLSHRLKELEQKIEAMNSPVSSR